MVRESNKWLVAICLSAVVGPVLAQDGAGGGNPNVAPQADAMLRRMSEHLVAAKRFSFRSRDMVDEIYDTGQKIQLSSTRQVTLQRPDRMAVDVEGDTLKRQVRYDGRTIALLDVEGNTYGRIDVPGSIDEMLDYVAMRFGITVPLADLMFSDPYGMVIDTVRAGYYLGLHDVFGVKCHHLAFQHDHVDWQIWIEDTGTPWPRKLVITYKALPGQPQFIALLDQWDAKPKIDDDAFKLKVPPNATEVPLEPLVDRINPNQPSGDAKSPVGGD